MSFLSPPLPTHTIFKIVVVATDYVILTVCIRLSTELTTWSGAQCSKRAAATGCICCVRFMDWRRSVPSRSYADISAIFHATGRWVLTFTYRSPVKERHVSWFVLGTVTLNGTDTTVKRLHRNVKTFSADSSATFANNGVCAIQVIVPKTN